MKIKGD